MIEFLNANCAKPGGLALYLQKMTMAPQQMPDLLDEWGDWNLLAYLGDQDLRKVDLNFIYYITHLPLREMFSIETRDIGQNKYSLNKDRLVKQIRDLADSHHPAAIYFLAKNADLLKLDKALLLRYMGILVQKQSRDPLVDIAIGALRSALARRELNLIEKEIHSKAAFAAYESAANAWFVEAKLNLGFCFHSGFGVVKDLTKALTRFREAAHRNVCAQRVVGERYHHGLGTEVNPQEAFSWYMKAASQGDAQAQYNVSWCYQTGFGVATDPGKAFIWGKRAANQGYRQDALGAMYLKGIGVAKNGSEAMRLTLAAAKLGHLDSQIYLANCYENGSEFIAKDLRSAFQWYEQAAKQGHVSSQYNLGRCYEEGLGCRRILAEARYWYEQAAKNGNESAKVRLNAMMSAPVASQAGMFSQRVTVPAADIANVAKGETLFQLAVQASQESEIDLPFVVSLLQKAADAGNKHAAEEVKAMRSLLANGIGKKREREIASESAVVIPAAAEGGDAGARKSQAVEEKEVGRLVVRRC